MHTIQTSSKEGTNFLFTFLIVLFFLQITAFEIIPTIRADSPIKINDIYVANERANVVDVTYVGFHLVWSNDNSPAQIVQVDISDLPGMYFSNFQGWVIIPVFSNSVGRKSWSIETIKVGGSSVTFQQNMSNPSVIFDIVIVELSAPQTRIGVGEEAEIRWSARYMFDDTPFTGSIELNNDELSSTDIGIEQFEVTEIIDETYGLTAFEANEIEIIFDRVVVELSVDASRIDVGSRADIQYTATYSHDGALFLGDVILNDSSRQGSVGKYGYEVLSVSDSRYSVDSFRSNELDIIFDEVLVELVASDSRMPVDEIATISYAASYAYDSMNFSGIVELNENKHTLHDVGSFTFQVTEIDDRLYDLTVFRSNDVQVIWDKILVELLSSGNRFGVGDFVSIVWNARYQYDRSVFEGEVILNSSNFTRTSVGELMYEVLEVRDHRYHISEFTSEPLVVIWDEVNITLEFQKKRIGVGQENQLMIQANYLYDETPFTGDILLNDTLIQNEVGMYGFTVSSIRDEIFNITSFTVSDVQCIWDLVDVVLLVPHDRIEVGKEVDITFQAKYVYDNAEFVGRIQLNDTKRHTEPGKHVFSIESVRDELYDVDSFTSNEVSCIWDLISSELFHESKFLGEAQVYLRLMFESGNIPDENAVVYMNDREAQNFGGGLYGIKIRNWLPRINLNVKVLSPGFDATILSYDFYLIYNVLLYSLLGASIGISISFILYVRNKKRLLKQRIMETVENNELIDLSEFRAEYNYADEKVMNALNELQYTNSLSGLTALNNVVFYSDEYLIHYINEVLSRINKVALKDVITNHPVSMTQLKTCVERLILEDAILGCLVNDGEILISYSGIYSMIKKIVTNTKTISIEKLSHIIYLPEELTSEFVRRLISSNELNAEYQHGLITVYT